MHYLVDGYNILFRDFEKGSLESRRDELVQRLIPAAEKVRITLFWDAAYVEDGGIRSHQGKLEIVYTQEGETADDAILSFLEHAGHACTIVTGDRPLSAQAKRLGATVMHGRPFLQLVDKWKSGRPTKASRPGTALHKDHLDHYQALFERRAERLGSKTRVSASSEQAVIEQFASCWERGDVSQMASLFVLPCAINTGAQSKHADSLSKLERLLHALIVDEQDMQTVTPHLTWQRKLSRQSILVLVEWHRRTSRGKTLPKVEWLFHFVKVAGQPRIVSLST